MSILNRVFKGFQGRANDGLEKIADLNLIPEIEQRIRDVKSKQSKVDDYTASTIGEKKVLEDKQQKLSDKMDSFKSKLKEVVGQHGKEHELVLKIVNELNILKTTMESNQQIIDEKNKTIEELKSQKRKNENSIKQMEFEIQSLKDQQKLIEAKEANANLRSNVGGTVNTAADAVSRLREKQAAQLAKLEAADSLSVEAAVSLEDEIDTVLGSNKSTNIDEWL